jgi:hypothetical protein
LSLDHLGSPRDVLTNAHEIAVEEKRILTDLISRGGMTRESMTLAIPAVTAVIDRAVPMTAGSHTRPIDAATGLMGCRASKMTSDPRIAAWSGVCFLALFRGEGAVLLRPVRFVPMVTSFGISLASLSPGQVSADGHPRRRSERTLGSAADVAWPGSMSEEVLSLLLSPRSPVAWRESRHLSFAGRSRWAGQESNLRPWD